MHDELVLHIKNTVFILDVKYQGMETINIFFFIKLKVKLENMMLFH